MKTKFTISGLLLTVSLMAAPKAEPPGPTLVLPTLVIVGHRIPSYWLEVTWECANPLPLCPIRKAWISKVGFGTPVADLGIKKGDILLEFDGKKMGGMTGDMLQGALKQWRAPGAHLELTLQTPGEKERSVLVVFSKPGGEVDHHISK